MKAEGYSGGLEKILQVARTLDENTMLLQYLDTLKQIGTSPSTKFVVPMELTNLLSSLRTLVPVEATPPTSSASTNGN